MADYKITTPNGQTIGREMLLCYLNVGSDLSPEWALIGLRTEDSSMEYDWGEETTQDIIGQTHTLLKKPVITQTFDPAPLDSGYTALTKIWQDAIVDQNYTALASKDMLIWHKYGGFAERYKSCMVKPTSLGGEGGGNIALPFDVTYGGERVKGTVSTSDGTVTFAPEAAE